MIALHSSRELMLPPILILTVLGILFGLGLCIASRMFRVSVDARVKRIERALPGANCGACGLAGCSALAKAIVHGSADVAACLPGGEAVAHLIGDIMGVEVKVEEKKVAILMCQGRDVKNRYEYSGVQTCFAANLMHGGPKECVFGCMGYGDCAKACPFGAIRIINGLPEVDEAKCSACGKCVASCPKALFKLHPLSKLVHVRCKSIDVDKDVRRYCKVGCIGCKKCEQVCKFNAVVVENNLAIFNYERCTSCGLCAKECPTGTIVNYRGNRKERNLWPVEKTA